MWNSAELILTGGPGCDLLKQDAKKEFKTSAFSLFVRAVESPWTSVRIVESAEFSSLQVFQNCFEFLGVNFSFLAYLSELVTLFL